MMSKMEQEQAERNNIDLNLLRTLLGITLLLNMGAFFQLVWPVYKSGLLFKSTKWALISSPIILGIVLVSALVLVAWAPGHKTLVRMVGSIVRSMARLRALNLVLFGFSVGAYFFISFGPYREYVQPVLMRLFLFWLVSLWGCLCIRAWIESPKDPGSTIINNPWLSALGISVLVVSFSMQIVSLSQTITTYPLTISWSETSRYYYASLFFADRIYGQSIPPSVLHPSRYLLQSVPFLISNSQLWLHRAWQVFLWLAATSATALLLIRRLNIKIGRQRVIFFLWAFQFILLGPVYYHLQVAVIIILWGCQYRERSSPKLRFLYSVFALLAASAWAGISRINWFPVPALLAAALYFLERPMGRPPSSTPEEKRKYFHPLSRESVIYLLKPVAMTLFGTAAAFASQTLYVLWSGNAAQEFTSSFSSDLLWYRLLPSATYPIGILPGILLVSLPLFLLIWSRLLQVGQNRQVWLFYNPMRLLGLAAILLPLFFGGLIVSVKIGGGSNLHNLDAYLVVLLVISAYFFFGQVIPDTPLVKNEPASNQINPEIQNAQLGSANQSGGNFDRVQKTRRVGIIMAVSITVLFTVLAYSAAIPKLFHEKAQKRVNNLGTRFEEIHSHGGEILLISNRHLVTFGYIDIPLIHEYERVFLMEMAMSNNTAYLNNFEDDLRNQRFDLILSEPLSRHTKDETSIFGEENNAWVSNITQHIFCYYEPEKADRVTNVQVFVPKPSSEVCK